MKKIAIDKATVAQLRTFATETLALEIPDNATKGVLLGLIHAAWDKPQITVADVAPETKQEGSAPRPADDSDTVKAGYVRVILRSSEGPGGSDDVQLGVNGRVNLYKREVPVDMHEDYFHALELAVQHRFEALKDGGINPVPREVRQIQYQVLARGRSLHKPPIDKTPPEEAQAA